MTSPDGPAAAALDRSDAPLPDLPVEDLMTQLGQRADDVVVAQRRLRGRLAANLSIVGVQSTAVSVYNPVARERLARTVEDLDETFRQIRTSIFALKSFRPVATSVRATVLAVVAAVTPVLGFRPTTHLAGPLDTLVEEDLVLDVAAAVRGSLAAVARHGNAGRSAVRVEADHRELRVVVTDDGPGLGQDGRRSGLADLHERALRRGGGMTTEQLDEGGLHVRWSVPLT